MQTQYMQRWNASTAQKMLIIIIRKAIIYLLIVIINTAGSFHFKTCMSYKTATFLSNVISLIND